MVGAHNDPLGPKPAPPLTRGSSVDGHRVLMGLLLLLIGVASIAGVAVAAASGQPTVAIIIALVAGAFFFGLTA